MSKLKQMLCRTKIKLAKKFFIFAFIWWKYWSNAYRRLYHSEYNNIELPKNLSLTEIESKMAALHWRPDGLKEFWDACGSPKRVQYILNEIAAGKNQPEGSLDCDDFSIWAANTIDKNFYPRVFSFIWVDKKSCTIKGHAMCLLRQQDGRIFHVGNWGTSRPFKNLRAACLDIIGRTDSEESIGWCLLDKNLNILKLGLELPSGSIS